MAAEEPRPGRWIGITPGTGTAVVGRNVAVLLAAGPDHTLVGELWAAVGDGDAGFDDALVVLGAAGFDRLPDLAMAGWEDENPRIVVRGDVAVAVSAGDGQHVEITGGEVHSWAEHSVPRDGTVHMRLGSRSRAAAVTDPFVVERGRLPAVALAIPTRVGSHDRADEAGDADLDDEGEALYSTVLVGGLPERPHSGVGLDPAPSVADPSSSTSVSSRPPPSPPPTTRIGAPPGIGVPPGPVRSAPERPAPAPLLEVPVGPSTTDGHVLAVRCAHDHLNPPHAHRCRVCDAPLSTDAPELVAELDLGVFRFSTGAVVEVTRPMLIGRAPKLAGQVRGDLPDLLPVPSPDQDISRTHLEVRLEGWQVLLVDKGSTNGTSVTLPGRESRRLRPDQPYPLPIGAVVSLADEVEFSFEAER